MGNHEEAIRSFRSGLSQMGQYGYGGALEHSHAKLAKSLMATGQLDEAGQQLQQKYEPCKPPLISHPFG